MTVQLVQQKKGPLPHFEITRELFTAMTFKEVNGTIAALHECGLLSLPYEMQTIRFSVEDVACTPGWGDASLRIEDVYVTMTCSNSITWTEEKTLVMIDSVLDCEREDGRLWWADWDRKIWRMDGWKIAEPIPAENLPAIRYYTDACNVVVRLLVAALATKNVAKTTAVNKRASRGIGSGKFRAANGVIRVSVTTLDVPKVYNETGRRVRMHLRRGHVHRWRKGDGTLVAKFLPAMLVNKDQAVTGAVTPEYKVTA